MLLERIIRIVEEPALKLGEYSGRSAAPRSNEVRQSAQMARFPTWKMPKLDPAGNDRDIKRTRFSTLAKKLARCAEKSITANEQRRPALMNESARRGATGRDSEKLLWLVHIRTGAVVRAWSPTAAVIHLTLTTLTETAFGRGGPRDYNAQRSAGCRFRFPSWPSVRS